MLKGPNIIPGMTVLRASTYHWFQSVTSPNSYLESPSFWACFLRPVVGTLPEVILETFTASLDSNLC